MKERRSPLFDYNLIRIMDEVIAAGSASKAAKRLNLSTSAVSLSLSRLQKHFGQELFIRTGTGLKPTPSALEINRSFRQAIDIVDNIIEVYQKEESHLEFLRITGSDFTEAYYVSQLIEMGYLQINNIVFYTLINQDEFELTDSLLQNKSDLALTFLPLVHESIISEKINSLQKFVAICRSDHLLAANEGITLANYYALPHAGMNGEISDMDTTLLGSLMHINHEFRGKRKIAYRSNSFSGIINAIEKSDMIAIVPEDIARFLIDKEKKKLATLSLPPELEPYPVNVYASHYVNSAYHSTIESLLTKLKAI
ncbi:LysR family transcriptional regulator [Chimaeribacter arupi]|uniref:LysR family transcriptional regulator n=1 Tax=Yersiniaceae TaxID=1903411 RepID=UPI0009353D08|nr:MULTISPECIES: LysR family transcriptional regulator [Yersiniaceae]PLR47935.1 LysR family transcriptional regulator [Chimaeribacter arupi]WKZ91875.1 LysR family transcriptional regulator [Chimaeribacter arupi]